jgi:hypothetical protein
MGEVKVVLDTNVLVSIIFKKRLAKEFSKLSGRGVIKFYTSKEILRELARVLSYPKIERVLEKSLVEKKEILESLVMELEVVEPKKRVKLMKEDPADNKILECALEIKADYIVSGNGHLLKLGKFKNAKILSPTKFFRKFTAK